MVNPSRPTSPPERGMKKSYCSRPFMPPESRGCDAAPEPAAHGFKAAG